MKTIHIPAISRRGRAAIILTPCVLNLFVCAVFIIVRPPAKALIEERERAQRMGAFTFSSGDPLMVIAERPLYQWSKWHGGEATWVKVAQVLNGPALIAAKFAGDRWSHGTAFSGEPTYRRESWVRAYVFLITATLQWLIVGALAAWFVERRRSRYATVPVASAQDNGTSTSTTRHDTSTMP